MTADTQMLFAKRLMTNVAKAAMAGAPDAVGLAERALAELNAARARERMVPVQQRPNGARR